MKIGILGTGIVSQNFSIKLIENNHEVMHGTRNIENTLKRNEPDNMGNPPFSQWLKKNSQVKIGTFKDAAAFGEIIINAVSGSDALAVLDLAGRENFNEKIFIDISNPLDFSKGFPPSLSVCNTDSLGERIQKSLLYAKVVKTLNTMTSFIMVNPALVPGDHNVFLSGDDPEAKKTVSEILTGAFGWKKDNIIDLGGISTARGTEMLLPIWITLFSSMQNPYFNFHIVKAGK